MDNKLQEAVVLYNKGNKAQALKLLAEIVRQEPSNSVAWYGLALCLDEFDKKVYCLKKVLSLDPTHKKARQLLEKLQGNEKAPSVQKVVKNSPASATAKKGTLPKWLGLSIVDIIGVIFGVIFFCVVVGIMFANNINIFQPTTTPIPTRMPPTHTPQPSPTSPIFTGNPLQYLPDLPDNYDIDYEVPNVNTTLQDGTVLYSIGFRNREAIFPGDLVTVVYYINIYPSEAKAISEYQKYVSKLGNRSEGILDNDIKIDGANATAIYIEPQGDNIVLGQYVSRINNVFITTMGFTSYDPQNVTNAFIKTLMANVAEVHILGINKFSK